ncbi:glycoside hydrolase family 97 protein [Novosphingobium aquae]|uniref:Glycoside hydrolase family 97 catalytic domain-containing protein n=1 Tax=Novosphingobium aquae TaxID=3133435 RepID=A0ABU8SAA5_9SPHN
MQFEGAGGRIEIALARTAHGGGLAWRALDREVELVTWSPLGLVVEGQSLFAKLEFDSAESFVEKIAYPLAHGAVSKVDMTRRRDRLWFRRPDGRRVGIEVHAARDGVALRYLVPDAPGGRPERMVDREETGFALPPGSRFWSQPYMYPWKFGPSYEYYFEGHSDSGTSERQVFPLLIAAKGRYAFVTETGVDGRYAASQLQPDQSGKVLLCDFPLAGEAMEEGKRNPAIRFPFESPWRLVRMGTLPEVFASSMVTDLAPQLDERFGGALPGWVKPTTLAWDWWNDRETGDVAEQRRYVDAAAEFRWGGVLVDAGWSDWNNGASETLVKELVDYAASKHIDIHLWYNSGGPNNKAGGQPRDLIHDPVRRRAEFARIAAMGVRGIKVDFWHSDKQLHIARYLEVLADAADNHLMVNFHGCTLPRGWERRFPNLMSMEAVRGGETYAFPGWYKWLEGDQGPAAIDHVRFALIRNLAGSMDYTPLVLEAARKAHDISYAHSLALPVVFESALLHCADSIEAYRSHFAAFPWMRQHLARLPSAWDQYVLVSGDPDSHVVVARRKGNEWYVAGINGRAGSHDLRLDLSALGAKAQHAEIISDGTASDQPVWVRTPYSGTLQLKMAASGGFVARLSPELAS